jgi:hypothetical protein
MRLRQAHAILEAATALHAAGLGFELFPFDHDRPGAYPVPDDYMTGYAEFNDPDNPTGDTRTYNLDLTPGSDGRTVSARVMFGYVDGDVLLDERFDVAAPDEEGETFRGLVGAGIAERVVRVVTEHEKPHREAYRKRSA